MLDGTKPKFNKTQQKMDFGSIIISLLLVSFVSPIYSFKTSSHHLVNQTFQIEEEFLKLKRNIKIRLQQINKPAIKTIQVF